LAISTSGKSENVIAAAKFAKEYDMNVICLKSAPQQENMQTVFKNYILKLSTFYRTC
jgi:phosphoheptose isomerase